MMWLIGHVEISCDSCYHFISCYFLHQKTSWHFGSHFASLTFDINYILLTFTVCSWRPQSSLPGIGLMPLHQCFTSPPMGQAPREWLDVEIEACPWHPRKVIHFYFHSQQDHYHGWKSMCLLEVPTGRHSSKSTEGQRGIPEYSKCAPVTDMRQSIPPPSSCKWERTVGTFLIEKGHELYSINWYSFSSLFHNLQARKTRADGIMQCNRKHMPTSEGERLCWQP